MCRLTPQGHKEVLSAVSRGLTRQIKLACNEVNDAGEVANGTIASGFGLGGLDEAFENAVVDLASEPAEERMVLATSMMGWMRLCVAQKYHLLR